MSELTFCISMSTIPSRIKNIHEVITNLNKQTLKPNKIYLNIPYIYKRFPNEIIEDKDIQNLHHENLEIVRCDDFGPGTKIMGSINEVRNYDCVIILGNHISLNILDLSDKDIDKYF